MASMREIKRRRGSIASTQQITKAMKLVSTVKLQHSRAQAENSKAYFDTMYQTVQSILKNAGNITHPYLQKGDSDKAGVVVITSNRGLAGGYNANLIRVVNGCEIPKEKIRIYAIGQKGADMLASRGYQICENMPQLAEEPSYEDAKALAKLLLTDFQEGRIGEIYLAYTEFQNTVTHLPNLRRLLPASAGEESETHDALTPMNFDSGEERTIDFLIPKYITSMIYGACMQSVASENGARMQAMESATKNAEELLDNLELQYNRARQGAITQELTEIIAGVEAIG